MKRLQIFGGTALLTLGLVACGGGDAGDDAASEPEAAAPTTVEAVITMPDWYRIDEAAQTVELDISAQMDGLWKFNGMSGGNQTIFVPVGYAVTINFVNDDPAVVHSLGIAPETGSMPAQFTDPEPVFAGGISSNPTSLLEATGPGESEIITFTADTAGEYSMLCYVPAHALSGMWVRFTVSADGESGVMM
jgi:FtsP/CotA-like multicopper oxidase with cupredoxin domain